MSHERFAFVVRSPASGKILDMQFSFEDMSRAAYAKCEMAGCDMKTFDYEGVVDDCLGARGDARERMHVWSALRMEGAQ